MRSCCAGFFAPKKGTPVCGGKYKIGDKVYPLPEVANHAANAHLGLDTSRACQVIGEGDVQDGVKCVRITDHASNMKGKPIDLWPADVSKYPNGEDAPHGTPVCAGKYNVGDTVYVLPQVAENPLNASLGLDARRAITVKGEGNVMDGVLCVRLLDPASKVGSEPIDLWPGDVSLYQGGIVPEGTLICSGAFKVGDLVYPANNSKNAHLGLDPARACTVLGEGDVLEGVLTVRLLDPESKMKQTPIDLWPIHVKKAD